MSNSFLFCLAAALASAALASPAVYAQGSNRGLESVHQPVVQRSDFVMDVSAAGLDRGEAARVGQWFNAIGLNYGDRISIDGGERSASSRDIAGIVGRYGLFVSEGAPVTEGPLTPGMVRIVVSRSTASVPGCPDYRRPSQPNFASAASSNFGCATNSMLAAMVADPADLVRGQDSSAPSAETASRAIRAWSDTDTTAKSGLKTESTKGGN